MEQELIPEYKTILLAPKGLGFGEGAISFSDRAKSEVSKTELSKVESLIRSKKILKAVDTDKHTGDAVDDDGCGDGRGVTDDNGNVVEITEARVPRKKSLSRAKVFGGGATMAVATLIGLGRHYSDKLEDVFSSAMSALDEAELNYGGHSDEHASEDKSGCGAIDNAPVIIKNALKYRSDIYDAILKLVPEVDVQAVDEVLGNYASFAESMDATRYKGGDIMDKIKQHKVVKKLIRGHSEMYIVLNDIEGYTVNQHEVRDASKEFVQVFAVDVWRAVDIAQGLYSDEPEAAQTRALISEIVFTLATAATLTKGDLPVYRVLSNRNNDSL